MLLDVGCCLEYVGLFLSVVFVRQYSLVWKAIGGSGMIMSLITKTIFVH